MGEILSGETGIIQEPPLSMEHMKAILDNAPVAVYVSAVQNMELLYANQMVRDLLFQNPCFQGNTCYQAAGYDKPCPFCHAGDMTQNEFLVREFYHPGYKRTYQLSGKIINWGGQPAHIEYILDITDKKREEDQSRAVKEELQTTFANIPCGLCVYQYADGGISPVFHNSAFYEIMGYSEEHIHRMEKKTDFLGVHPEDLELLQGNIMGAIRSNGVMRQTYRVFNDKTDKYHYIHLEGAVKAQADGKKLLYGVYSDVSEQVHLEKELAGANEQMQDIINAIPGGVAIYLVENNRFFPIFASDGVMSLSGHTREDYVEMIGGDVFDIIYEPDRERVLEAAKVALISGEVLDVSYRMYHKDGHLIWIHLNGRRMGNLSETMKFYAVLTGMSAETRLFQNIANETADGIYVIDKKNYDLLYINESRNLFTKKVEYIGQKCYTALHGRGEPCEFCILHKNKPDGAEHEVRPDDSGSCFSTRFRETEWNGIPAYVNYVRDISDEVRIRQEKERLEQYFQTLVKNLPGGVSVVRYERDKSMVPEFLSDGFAELTGMPLEDAWKLYQTDAMAGVHPDDKEFVYNKLTDYIASGESQCEIVYRLKKGDGSYVSVKNNLSMFQNENGESRVYAVYHDMTREIMEQEQLRQQYKDMLIEHYRIPVPNALIIGHCNVTQNEILEIIDHTDSDLLNTLGSDREGFFTGIASLVVDEKERETFLKTYLNAPALAAFERNDREQILKCFIKMPREKKGRYVQFKVNLVEVPDTGDVTGILTVTDITEQTISDRILHQLSVTAYDFVIDLNLELDTYTVLTSNQNSDFLPAARGRHSERMADMLSSPVVPKDRDQYARLLDPEGIRMRLAENGSYTFAYSTMDDKGDIRTKNMTVSEVDLRLGRVCLVRTDITDSVREQQGLFNMIAYTFELAGFIDINTKRLVTYTRQTVLENLTPFIEDNYENAKFTDDYGNGTGEDREEVLEQFLMENMIRRLQEKPSGYDFVLPFRSKDGLRYKQINVLWGDVNHSTICLVRADVTDMLSAERQVKQTLENALTLAKEANRAKSDFLSAMSHDIRTPMNAIMGMTTLATAHIGEPERVKDCLQKISVSSRHLLSLINDILDMSKIERSNITLNRMKISLSDLLDQLSAIITPQAEASGLKLEIRTEGILHEYFYGDSLRINQIFINILGNAMKFTPECGTVQFLVEEMPSVKGTLWARYRFSVSDTGIGMSEEFLGHIFEPFTRSSTAGNVEGTGLGLSITKGLVDLMEGKIFVESQINKGSTFRVELECEAAQGEAVPDRNGASGTAADVPENEIFAGRRFLVAEDNAINAEILCELLEMYGAVSVVKRDGAEAVQAFQNAVPGTYDAILMDVRMPGMNGYEATRAIRELDRPDAKQIVIIAMTANAFEEDIQEALNSGMDAHLAKPLDFMALHDILCKLLK